MPKLKGVWDLIKQPLYDRNTVTTSNTTSLTFFQTPVGQSSKTRRDTNMALAGQVSAHQEALVIGIQLKPVLVAAHTFTELANQVINGGYLVFTVMQKTFLELPLLALPGGSAIVSHPTTTQNNTLVDRMSLGWPIDPNMFKLDYPVKLEKGQNFDVTLYWPTAPSLTTAMDLYVLLCGYMKRPVL